MRKHEVIELPARRIPEGERPQRQLKVAAYCRVSTSLESQQNSYQAQKDYDASLIGYSFRDIKSMLEDQGVPTKNGQAVW